MVLQSLHQVSDREALKELRFNLAWKVAAGVPITDEGFDPSVLVYWRNRLRESGSPDRIFDAVRGLVAETGVLAKRTARVLDPWRGLAKTRAWAHLRAGALNLDRIGRLGLI